ncbi:unnamed protein product [Trichobilharzia regenti]|nr:unnamed protein product [Trichobilharzia regenti]
MSPNNVTTTYIKTSDRFAKVSCHPTNVKITAGIVASDEHGNDTDKHVYERYICRPRRKPSMPSSCYAGTHAVPRSFSEALSDNGRKNQNTDWRIENSLL